MLTLRNKVRASDEGISKVISIYLGVIGGNEENPKVIEAVATSNKTVYKIEKGKRVHINSDNLYYYTPELEEKPSALLKKANELKTEIQETLSTAKKYPSLERQPRTSTDKKGVSLNK